MREILFRGKCLNVGNWVYGNYTSEAMHYGDEYDSAVHEMWHYIESPCGHLEASGLDRVDPDTVGQYTGLHDIDGNQIFEGDIVKGMFNYEWITGVVTYGDEGMFYIERESGVGLGLREADSWLHVIGNKWDGVKK